MSRTELTTNIFPIANLDQLATSFTLFRMRSLNSKQPEYHANRSHIELALKRVTHSSVVLYEDHGEGIAAVRFVFAKEPEFCMLISPCRKLLYMTTMRKVPGIAVMLRVGLVLQTCNVGGMAW